MNDELNPRFYVRTFDDETAMSAWLNDPSRENYSVVSSVAGGENNVLMTVIMERNKS